jgi:peptidoglycan hydrolase CwlO-like protein
LEFDKEIIEDFKKKNTELKEKLKKYEKADEEVGMPQSETDEGNQ